MNQFPPPRPLTTLVSALGVDGVRDLALACGAIDIAAKPNQVWRCVLEEQVIIGYKTSAVVAGRDELAMDYVVSRLNHQADDDADDTTARYHAYAMAMDVRRTMTRSARADLETILPVYTELIARLFALDEVVSNATFRLLAIYAPAELRMAQIALAVYEHGMIEGLDAAAPALDEDDFYLPDVPDALPPMVSSA